jgi:isopenicillin-N epimerase
MIGSLGAVPLPPLAPEAGACFVFADPWQRRLMDEHGIEVPVFTWPAAPRRVLRISAQLYNIPAHYERLAAALEALLAGG